MWWNLGDACCTELNEVSIQLGCADWAESCGRCWPEASMTSRCCEQQDGSQQHRGAGTLGRPDQA